MSGRVLLIGGNGFIGSHLIDELVYNSYHVNVLDCQNELFREKNKNINYYSGSFIDSKLIQKASKGCDIIIHLAHSTIPSISLNHPEEEILESISGFVNLVNCLKSLSISKIVYFSSGGTVYGNPINLPVDENTMPQPISPYGVAKLAIENYLHMFSHLNGFDYIIIRPSNPYGPRQNYLGKQGIIGIFMNKIINNQTIDIWGDGNIIKDFIYIEDLTAAVIKLINRGFNNQIYNIGSGTGVSLNHIIELLSDVTGIKPRVIYKDPQPHDVKKIILSIEKIKSRIIWEPTTSLIDGIRINYEWYKSINKYSFFKESR